MNEIKYKAMVKSWGRSGMLSILRAAGFTCHKLKSDDDLAHALWLLKRRIERDRARLTNLELSEAGR